VKVLVVASLIIIALIIIFQAIHICGFFLSDVVLVSLAGSVAIQAIGLYLIIVKSLFPESKSIAEPLLEIIKFLKSK